MREESGGSSAQLEEEVDGGDDRDEGAVEGGAGGARRFALDERVDGGEVGGELLEHIAEAEGVEVVGVGADLVEVGLLGALAAQAGAVAGAEFEAAARDAAAVVAVGIGEGAFVDHGVSGVRGVG